MDKIDKTKDNVGISKLDEGTKKNLFNKFLNAGGEILDERTKRKSIIINKNNQNKLQRRLDAYKKNLRQDSSTKKTASKARTPQRESYSTTVAESKPNFFTRFMIRLRLRIHNISDLSGLYFKLKFLERFNNVYKPALMELQMIYLDIFKKKPRIGNQIIMRLDKNDPLNYELIMMIGDLYEKMLSDQIVDHYINFPDIPKKVSELKEPLMSIYKKILVLRTYQSYIVNAFERSIDLLNKLDKEKTSGISSMKRKVRNDVYILFEKLLPRLHILFCYYEGNKFEMFDPAIESILTIKDSDKPGNRKKYSADSEENLNEVEVETEAKEEEDEIIPEYIKKGLNMMYELDLKALRKEYDKDGNFKYTSENDKVLITYLLYTEFDREYSFLLTTNKVKYNISLHKTGPVDYRTMLHNLYDDMRKCNESFKSYTDILETFDKLKNERAISNAQYIEFTKRLESLNKKRIVAGREALRTVHDHLEKVTKAFQDFAMDMGGSQAIIENPQDVLEFEAHIEGIKKINGKKVYEAIQIVYQFISAFLFRLGPEGDLSGSLEFKEDEKDSGKPSNQQKTSVNENKSQASEKSVLDELDDML